jgi:low affinity Fe/Cu permease
MRDLFHRWARRVSNAMGSPAAFFIALIAILAWAVTGPLFGYSNTWQLMINTGTTIATFLMVFLIQNTQNRDSRVLQLKLDELLRSVPAARNSLVDLEDLTEEELDRLSLEFKKVRDHIVSQRKDPKKKGGHGGHGGNGGKSIHYRHGKNRHGSK